MLVPWSAHYIWCPASTVSLNISMSSHSRGEGKGNGENVLLNEEWEKHPFKSGLHSVHF